MESDRPYKKEEDEMDAMRRKVEERGYATDQEKNRADGILEAVRSDYEAVARYPAKLHAYALRRLRKFAELSAKKVGRHPFGVWLEHVAGAELDRELSSEPTLPRLPLTAWNDHEMAQALVMLGALLPFAAGQSDGDLREFVAELARRIVCESASRLDAKPEIDRITKSALV